jgi:hypothetical protein
LSDPRPIPAVSGDGTSLTMLKNRIHMLPQMPIPNQMATRALLIGYNYIVLPH